MFYIRVTLLLIRITEVTPLPVTVSPQVFSLFIILTFYQSIAAFPLLCLLLSLSFSLSMHLSHLPKKLYHLSKNFSLLYLSVEKVLDSFNSPLIYIVCIFAL